MQSEEDSESFEQKQPKNSNNGIGKLVVFLTVIELELKAWRKALDIFYESLILAQDERWRRA